MWDYVHFTSFLLCMYGPALSHGNNTTTLHVGALLELSGYRYYNLINLLPYIFEDAFRQIEDRDDILPGFRFELTIWDTEGESGNAAIQMVKLLEEGPPKVAVIGPSSSFSLTVTGQIAPRYNVIEMGLFADTASTVDKSLFPTLYKVMPASDLFNPLRIKIMKQFGWSRVATVINQDDISVSQMNIFHSLLQENNFTLVSSAVLSQTSSVKGLISAFKQFDVRILFGAFHADRMKEIFCEAYHAKLYGESYVWILAGSTLQDNWMQYNDKVTDCTDDQILTAAEGIYTMELIHFSNSVQPTITGRTPQEEIARMTEIGRNASLMLYSYHACAYDTIWTLALGLNHSLAYLQDAGLSLHRYINNEAYLDAISKGMHDVNFDGVSVRKYTNSTLYCNQCQGPVSLDESGARIGVTYIARHTKAGVTTVAYYDHMKDTFSWTDKYGFHWQDGKIPKDRFTYMEHVARASESAFVVVVLGATGGILLSSSFLFFNIHFSESRSIKMSSPMMNNVIIGGSLLMYVVVLVDATDYVYQINVFCMAKTWLASVGFTLLFGGLFSKTYRVYLIFRDHKIRNHFIRVPHLALMTSGLLLVDLIVLIPWTIVHPLHKHRFVLTSQEHSNIDVIYSDVYLSCIGTNKAYWQIALYVYKGLLMAFGTFLAWETRNVSIPELNDSRNIGICIYNVVISCIFGVPITHVLKVEQLTLTFILESLVILFCTTSTLCILFIPKILARNEVNTRTRIAPSVASTSRLTNNEFVPKDNVTTQPPQPNMIDTVANLQEENKRLRLAIAKETIAITKLKKAIQDVTGGVYFYKTGDEYTVCTINVCPIVDPSQN